MDEIVGKYYSISFSALVANLMARRGRNPGCASRVFGWPNRKKRELAALGVRPK
jgi:hypothetical protein